MLNKEILCYPFLSKWSLLMRSLVIWCISMATLFSSSGNLTYFSTSYTYKTTQSLTARWRIERVNVGSLTRYSALKHFLCVWVPFFLLSLFIVYSVPIFFFSKFLSLLHFEEEDATRLHVSGTVYLWFLFYMPWMLS